MVEMNKCCACKEEESCNVLVWILAIIGVVVAIAGIAYAVYSYMNRKSLEEFEDEFDEEEDIFEEEEDFFEEEADFFEN